VIRSPPNYVRESLASSPIAVVWLCAQSGCAGNLVSKVQCWEADL
jgi:hypothetical protein